MMFECCREIEILHGAFISAQKSVAKTQSDASTSLCGLSGHELDLAISIVTQTVEFIKSGYGGSVKNWSRETERLAMQRIHTALFYKLLSSSGITCNAAEEYYQSIANYLVDFDWKFYVQLITDLSFTDHFAQCMTQLPDNVAAVLLQWTMCEFDRGRNSSCLYSILQVLACKILHVNYRLSASEAFSCFDFPFKLNSRVLVENVSKEDDESIGVSKVSNSDSEVSVFGISDQMLHLLKNELSGTEFMPVLFKWTVFVMDKLISSDVNSASLTDSYHIEPYLVFVKSYAQSETGSSYLEKELFSFSYEELKLSVESGTSFIICIGYVLYLMHAKWLELEKFCEDPVLESSFIKTLKETVDSSYVFHPLSSISSSSNLEPYIKMLICLIDHKFDGMTYALEILLQSDVLCLTEEAISCIERNLHHYISDMFRMKQFLDVAVKISGPEKRKVVQVFLKACSMLSLSDQHYMLETSLKEYGLNTSLELPSFKNDLVVFNKRTRNVDEVIHLIPQLCIQSPEKTVNGIIDFIIEYEPPMLIQALKAVRCVCCYSAGVGSPTLLIRLLKPYFSRENLDAKKKPHILFLTRELLKVFGDDDDAFPLGQFLRFCVIPNLSSQLTVVESKFFLEVLNMVLEHSVHDKHVTWLKDINLTAFVVWLCCLINLCITSYNGDLKDMLVCALDLFSNLIRLCPVEWNLEVNQKCLLRFVSAMHPSVEFYVWDYIHDQNSDLPSLDLQSYICWWIIRYKTDTLLLNHSDMKDSDSIVVALAQNLPHFTKDEFLRLYHMFGCIDAKIFPQKSSATITLLADANNPDLLNKKLQAINLVEVLVNAFLLLKHQQSHAPFDWPYMLSNFSSTVQVCLSEVKTCPLTLTKVFFEVCRMAEAFKEDIHVLGVALHNIQALVNDSVADSVILKSCKNNLLAAVQNLHQCDEKYRLLDYMYNNYFAST